MRWLVEWLGRRLHLTTHPRHDPRLDKLDERSRRATNAALREIPDRVVRRYSYADRVILGIDRRPPHR